MAARKQILRSVSIALVGFGMMLSGIAHAVLLDFDSLPASTNLAGVPNNSSSVLTTNFASSGIVFGREGISAGVAVVTYTSGGGVSAAYTDPNFISGLDASGALVANSIGDIHFYFVDPSNVTVLGMTNFVSFYVGDGGGDTDSWNIRAYDVGGTVLDSRDLSGTTHEFYSLALPGIHRVEILWTTQSDNGYGLDNLTFNTPTGIPEPATLALVGLGLAGLGVSRSRAR